MIRSHPRQNSERGKGGKDEEETLIPIKVVVMMVESEGVSVGCRKGRGTYHLYHSDTLSVNPLTCCTHKIHPNRQIYLDCYVQIQQRQERVEMLTWVLHVWMCWSTGSTQIFCTHQQW